MKRKLLGWLTGLVNLLANASLVDVSLVSGPVIFGPVIVRAAHGAKVRRSRVVYQCRCTRCGRLLVASLSRADALLLCGTTLQCPCGHTGKLVLRSGAGQLVPRLVEAGAAR